MTGYEKVTGQKKQRRYDFSDDEAKRFRGAYGSTWKSMLARKRGITPDQIRSSNDPVINRPSFPPLVQYTNLSRRPSYRVKTAGPLKRAIGRGLETSIRKGTPHRVGASVLAHEYGHAKTLLGAPKPLRALRMFGYGHGSTAGTAINLMNPRSSRLRRAGVQAAGEAPKLVEEFLATYHGLKALKKMKRISPKMYKRARKDLLQAYGTYFTGASLNVVGASLPRRSTPNIERAERLALMLGANMVIKGLAKGMHEGHRSGPALGILGRRRLAKLMGQQGTLNMQPLRGPRPALSAFFAPPGRPGPLGEIMLRKKYGHGATERLIREGVVSVPLRTKGEMQGKKGLREKLLDISYKMQQGS